MLLIIDQLFSRRENGRTVYGIVTKINLPKNRPLHTDTLNDYRSFAHTSSTIKMPTNRPVQFLADL